MLLVTLGALYGAFVCGLPALGSAALWVGELSGIIGSARLADALTLGGGLLGATGGAILGGWLGWKCHKGS